MNKRQRIEMQPGFVLHSRPYRDTSAIIELFTSEHGRIGVVARGVRKAKSRLQGVLQPFQALLVSWSGAGELYTLTAAEVAARSQQLQGQTLMCGFYLNELLLRLLHRHDPHPGLFEAYAGVMQTMASGNKRDEALLRGFEHSLLQEVGYGMQLTHDSIDASPVEAETLYYYHPESGPVVAASVTAEELPAQTVHGRTLLELDARCLQGERSLREAKLLMRAVLNHYLERPLKTRDRQWYQVI